MIERIGNLGPKPSQHKTIYGKSGLAPTIAACDYKDPTKILEDPHDRLRHVVLRDTTVRGPRVHRGWTEGLSQSSEGVLRRNRDARYRTLSEYV